MGVAGIVVSFDNRYLCACGYDGMIAVYKMKFPKSEANDGLEVIKKTDTILIPLREYKEEIESLAELKKQVNKINK